MTSSLFWSQVCFWNTQLNVNEPFCGTVYEKCWRGARPLHVWITDKPFDGELCEIGLVTHEKRALLSLTAR